MKTTKKGIWYLLIAVITICYSCSKSKEKPDTNNSENEWKFTKAVNTHRTHNSGYGLDFYQYKGDQVRILQFEFDDFVNLYFLNSIALKANDLRLPISSTEGYLTVDNQFFDKKANRVYRSDKMKWALGDAPYFNVWSGFDAIFNNLSAPDRNAGNYDACLYSYEKPNAALPAQDTYTFFDFKNNKAVFYAPGNPSSIVRTTTINELFPIGGSIDWTKIDAATNDAVVKSAGNTGMYFFDFDAQKMYTAFRSGDAAVPKNTKVETGLDFSKQIHVSYGSGSNAPFDFKK